MKSIAENPEWDLSIAWKYLGIRRNFLKWKRFFENWLPGCWPVITSLCRVLKTNNMMVSFITFINRRFYGIFDPFLPKITGKIYRFFMASLLQLPNAWYHLNTNIEGKEKIWNKRKWAIDNFHTSRINWRKCTTILLSLIIPYRAI